MTGKFKSNLCCHLLLPKNKSCVTQLLWRPRPGHWCSQGRNIWAVAEACGHYPRRMLLGVANQLTQAIDHQAQRWMENWHCTTSKPCLHSNLQTLRPVGTSAVAACCVSIAAYKRRPRNRPCPSRLCWSAVVTNSAKVLLPENWACWLKAQCGLNLANALIPIKLDQNSFNQWNFDEIEFKKKTVINKTLSG